MRYLIFKFIQERTIKRIVVLAGNADNGEYNWLKQDVHSRNFDDRVKELLDRENAPGSDKPEPVLVIFEDTTGKVNWRKPIYDSLLTDFRHKNISIFIVAHYTFKITPTVRSCLTNAAIFEQQGLPSLKATYESFGQAYFPTLQEWIRWLTDNTSFLKKQFVLYSMNPAPGESNFQPMICPKDIPQFTIWNKKPREDTEDERPNKRQRV